jgi:hypothetical protein
MANADSDGQGFLAFAASAILSADDRQDRKYATELQEARDRFCANHISISENISRSGGGFASQIGGRRNFFAHEHNSGLRHDVGFEFRDLKEEYERMFEHAEKAIERYSSALADKGAWEAPPPPERPETPPPESEDTSDDELSDEDNSVPQVEKGGAVDQPCLLFPKYAVPCDASCYS